MPDRNARVFLDTSRDDELRADLIAAITAGGRANDAFAREIGASVKALAVVNGVTLLDRAIDAARGAGARRVVVIGGEHVRARCEHRVEAVLEESASGSENVRRAIASCADEPLLLCSSDMPFVTSAAMLDFVTRARWFDLALPLAEGAEYERIYPDAPPHVTALGRDRVANGNVVYFGPGVATRAIDVAQRFFDARKSLTRMAALLGPTLLVRFATRTLRIAHVEARGHRVLGLDVRAIRAASPTLCFDIDSIDDYRYAVGHAARA